MQEKLPASLKEKERKLKWGQSLKTAKKMQLRKKKKTHGSKAVKRKKMMNMDPIMIRVNFKDMIYTEMELEHKVQLWLRKILNMVKDSLKPLKKR